MLNSRIAGLVLAAMVFAPVPAALAQSTNVAYAAAPQNDFVVFLDSGAKLSPVASQTIQRAAAAARSARSIYITGRGDYAQTVKSEMMRQGIPENAIVVTAQATDPLPRVPDGLRNPIVRRVEISF